MVSEPRFGAAHLISTAENNQKMEKTIGNKAEGIDQHGSMLTEGNRAWEERLDSMFDRMFQKIEEVFKRVYESDQLSQYPPQQWMVLPQYSASPPSNGTDEGRTLWIGDLQYWMDENYLNTCFYQTGELLSAKVIRNEQTGQSEGYGFLEFRTRAIAENIMQTYNGTTMPNAKQTYGLKWATRDDQERRTDDSPEHTIFVGDLDDDDEGVVGGIVEEMKLMSDEGEVSSRYGEHSEGEDSWDVKCKYEGEVQFAFCRGEHNGSWVRNQGYGDGVQEKRDAAVSATVTALEKHEKPFSMGSGITTCENQVEAQVITEKKPDIKATESSMNCIEKPVDYMNIQVKSYPELVKLCQEMNTEGLHKFISDNRKNLATLREEIPAALKVAPDAASLVLDSLKGFYGVDMPSSDAKKDSNLLGLRRTCILLMECFSSLFINLDADSRSVIISENSKERAKAIAEEWKPKLADLDVDASNGNSLEAHAFLQLLATFGINSEFDQESLSNLIPMVSRRRQTAELCRYLGLSDKMPGVINVLINNGRQIDAVNLAFAFELTDRYSPTFLLESYLVEAKNVSSAAKPGNASTAASTQIDVNEKELTALKAVIKCIEDHKLEQKFPLDPLQKQVLEIEKAKADKKRGTEVAKPQSKRPRANGIAHAQRASSFAADKNSPVRYPQYIYDRPYGYPAGPTDHLHHLHHHHHHVPSFANYNFAPAHGHFFGNGYQYQTSASYLH